MTLINYLILAISLIILLLPLLIRIFELWNRPVLLNIIVALFALLAVAGFVLIGIMIYPYFS